MNIADFRIQTGVPTTPPAGVVGLYANASGALITQSSAGVKYQIGGQLTGVILNASIVLPGAGTGITFQPTGWIAALGPTGQKFAIPVFLYS